MEKVTVMSVDTTENFRAHVDQMREGVSDIINQVKYLQKISTPVYDHYKPFKDVSVDKKFAYGPSIYKKHEVFNMLGNNVNAFNLNKNQYEYIPDYEWVVVLD